MLLNRLQKEQFKADYPVLNYPKLQVKYGASSVKIRELAVTLGLEKPLGRGKGNKDRDDLQRKYKSKNHGKSNHI